MDQQDINSLQEENKRLREELDSIREGRVERRRKMGWLGRRIGGAFAGSWLRNSMLKLIREIPEKNIQKETLADVSASLFWRLTRFGVMAILLALLPTTILLFQTNLLLRQNKILKKQNFRLDQQTNLAEAERRSSLVFVMSALMEEMHTEARSNGGRVSDGLIARIAGLSQSLKPYRFLENDALTERPYSPEKGQLLLNVALSDISASSRLDLFEKTDFSGSDLKGAELNLSRISNCRMRESRFDRSRIFNAEWKDIEMNGSLIQSSWIEGSALRDCGLSAIRISGTGMFNTAISSSDLKNSEWESSVLNDVIFMDADLSNTGFTDCVLSGVIFSGSSNVSTINLEGSFTDDDQFFERLIEAGIPGSDQLAQKFRLGKAADPGAILDGHPMEERFEALTAGKTFYPIRSK